MKKFCTILFLLLLCTFIVNAEELINDPISTNNVEEIYGIGGSQLVNTSILLKNPIQNNKIVLNETLSDTNKELSQNSDAVANYNLGLDAYYQGNYKLAIEYFTKAIQYSPNNALAYNGRGEAYTKLGNYELAIADFTKAIQYESNYVVAYNMRGEAYRLLGNYDQAIDDFNIAIQLDSYNAFAYANRGVTYKNLGNYNQAIADYTKAIQLDPNDAWLTT